MKQLSEVVQTIFIGIAIAATAFMMIFVVSFIIAFPIKWLWNWVMVDLFAFPIITYWQAWGMNMLSTLLFRSSSQSNSDKD